MPIATCRNRKCGRSVEYKAGDWPRTLGESDPCDGWARRLGHDMEPAKEDEWSCSRACSYACLPWRKRSSVLNFLSFVWYCRGVLFMRLLRKKPKTPAELVVGDWIVGPFGEVEQIERVEVRYTNKPYWEYHTNAGHIYGDGVLYQPSGMNPGEAASWSQGRYRGR